MILFLGKLFEKSFPKTLQKLFLNAKLQAILRGIVNLCGRGGM
jgi:hypothetical protein